FSQGNVAPEARSRHSHAWMRKTVVRTVGRSPALVTGLPLAGGFDAVTGMVKVVGAQSVSKGGKIECSQERWQLIPPHKDIDDAIGCVEKPLQRCRMKFEAVVFARHLRRPVFVKPYRALNNTALFLNVKRATQGLF